MPRFYLHLCDSSGFTEDEEGLVLAGEAEAREAAIAAMRDVSAGDIRRGELNLGSFIEIANDRHEFVATIAFKEAVHVWEERGTLGRQSPPASSHEKG